MSLVFDLIILAVCVISIVLGAKRGFIKSVMGVCTLIAALCLAYAFTPVVSDSIRSTDAMKNVSESIGDTIKSLSHTDEGGYDLEKMFSDMPDAFRQILDRYNTDDSTLAETVVPEASAPESAVDMLADAIAEPVVRAISDVAAFLLIFVASVAALKLLTWLLDLLFQLPVLKTANTMLGLLVGVVIALFWAWVLCPLSVTLIRAMSSISPDLFNESVIENSVILSFFADNKIGDILGYLIG